MPELHRATKELQKHKFSGSEEGNEYSGTEFGGFGEYFHNKLLKLQNQAQEYYEVESNIFKDCVIYITGYTRPSSPEIKRLVTTHGGIICHYLAGKTYATHIVANSLTARKRIEYAKYKVVRPEWITESIREGKQLPWHRFRVTSEDVNVQKPVQERLPDALDPNFVDNYYKNSRLHHLSSWRSELKRKFQSMAKKCNAKSNQQSSEDMRRRVIIHVDFDSFFVAVSLLKNPELKGKPICVSSSQSGNGDVASCSYEARKYGVKNGMWVSQAKRLCPDLKTIPYDFEGYEKASNALYNILVDLDPDALFPVSVDEALVDVTSLVQGTTSPDDHAKNVLEFCRDLRKRIKDSAMINASVGAAPNVLLAKVALRRAKPDGEFYVPLASAKKFLGPLPVRDLPGIGPHISRRLEGELKIITVEDVRETGERKMCNLLGGKLGKRIFDQSQGLDDTDIIDIPPPKSIGVEIAWGIRLKTNEHIKMFVKNLCSELYKRMNQESTTLQGCQLVVKIYQRHPEAPVEPPKYLGHGHCEITSKSSPQFPPSNDPDFITKTCCDLVASFQCPPQDFRGLGIQLTKLAYAEDTKQQRKLEFAPTTNTNISLRRNPSPQTTPTKRFSKDGNTSPSPVKLGNVPQFMTITQQFRRQHEGVVSPRRKRRRLIDGAIDVPSEISREIFDELPPELQSEIVRIQGKPPGFTSRKTKTEIINYVPVAFFNSISDESKIRHLISSWIKSTEYPHYDDVCLIEQYLINVISHDRDWGKATRLLEWMSHCAKSSTGPEWWPLIDILRENIVKPHLNKVRGINI
jgi:DNA repair protein REV1